MTFRSLTTRDGAGTKTQTASRPGGMRTKSVPVYEKPLVKTGVSALWKTFTAGDRVQVILGGNHIRTGTVDVRTRDGGTVWIFLDQGMGRIAVSDGDGAALVLLE